MTDGKLDAVFFKKIKTDIHTFPKQYALAGKWLDDNYWDEDKVWRAIERRSSKLLEKSFQREDRLESPSFIRPDSDLDICKVLQAVAVVDMGFWPDLEHLLARYKEAANAIPHNFRTITERTSTRGKIVKFLDELLPFYREHQAGLVCRWHGLYIACEDLIEKHEQIGVLDELDNKRVCLLTWLIGCPDLGAKRLNLTEFENIPWSLTCGTETTPHRAKVYQVLEFYELLPKWQKLASEAIEFVGVKPKAIGGATKEIEWSADAPEFIPNSEAIKLAEAVANEKISLPTLSKILSPDGPIRYMRNGQRCKVHIQDFRAYIKTLKKEIMDEDIEDYLSEVAQLKEEIKQEKSQ